MCAPLLDQAAGIAAHVEGVIDRRPVGIDVGEAGRHGSLAAGRLDERVFRRLAHGAVKGLEPVPGDRGLERVVDYAHRHGRARARRACG